MILNSGNPERETFMSRYFNDFSGLDDSESLEHYGVKGMKWGVRKDNYIDGHGNLTKSGSNHYQKIISANKKSDSYTQLVESRKAYKKAKDNFNAANDRLIVKSAPKVSSKGYRYGFDQKKYEKLTSSDKDYVTSKKAANESMKNYMKARDNFLDTTLKSERFQDGVDVGSKVLSDMLRKEYGSLDD